MILNKATIEIVNFGKGELEQELVSPRDRKKPLDPSILTPQDELKARIDDWKNNGVKGEQEPSLRDLAFVKGSAMPLKRFTIVVLGAESSGKSTILDRMCLMPIFPKGAGMCIKLPIYVHFIQKSKRTSRREWRCMNAWTMEKRA